MGKDRFFQQPLHSHTSHGPEEQIDTEAGDGGHGLAGLKKEGEQARNLVLAGEELRYTS